MRSPKLFTLKWLILRQRDFSVVSCRKHGQQESREMVTLVGRREGPSVWCWVPQMSEEPALLWPEGVHPRWGHGGDRPAQPAPGSLW